MCIDLFSFLVSMGNSKNKKKSLSSFGYIYLFSKKYNCLSNDYVVLTWSSILFSEDDVKEKEQIKTENILL